MRGRQLPPLPPSMREGPGPLSISSYMHMKLNNDDIDFIHSTLELKKLLKDKKIAIYNTNELWVFSRDSDTLRILKNYL